MHRKQIMRLHIRVLKEQDVTEDYPLWFSNKDVVRFSQNQHKTFSLMGQKKYVKSCYYDDDQNLYGIFDNEKHIGNILVKGLLSVHKHAEITYVVGNTTYWVRGLLLLLSLKLFL